MYSSEKTAWKLCANCHVVSFQKGAGALNLIGSCVTG